MVFVADRALHSMICRQWNQSTPSSGYENCQRFPLVFYQYKRSPKSYMLRRLSFVYCGVIPVPIKWVYTFSVITLFPVPEAVVEKCDDATRV